DWRVFMIENSDNLNCQKSAIVTSVRLYSIQTPRLSGDASQHVLIRLDTDSGIVGVGEYADITDLPLTIPDLDDLQKSLTNVLSGQNALELARLDHLLGLLFTGRGDTGIYTGSLRAAIEMALHDIAGKELGVPVYVLFGGPVRTKIKVCFPIFRNLDEKHIERNLQIVDDLLNEGFDNFRIYIGGNPDADDLFLASLRRQVGDRITMQAFDLSNHVYPADSTKLINRLRKYYEPQYVESVAPTHDFRGMAEVRAKLDIPVSEHVGDARHAIALWEARAVDIINVANSSHGGMRESLKVFAVAEALGLRTILSTTQETSLGTAAEAHVGASVVNIHYPTVAIGPKLYTEDPAKNKIQYSNGYMLIPDGPGLGIEIDWEKVEALKHQIGWRDYGIDHAVPDVHDRAWKVNLSTGLMGVRKK
ncbi:MAG: mandelate racemase/muconate lactonizing enzyme family protein, partial [Terriglobia bacterium]